MRSSSASCQLGMSTALCIGGRDTSAGRSITSAVWAFALGLARCSAGSAALLAPRWACSSSGVQDQKSGPGVAAFFSLAAPAEAPPPPPPPLPPPPVPRPRVPAGASTPRTLCCVAACQHLAETRLGRKSTRAPVQRGILDVVAPGPCGCRPDRLRLRLLRCLPGAVVSRHRACGRQRSFSALECACGHPGARGVRFEVKRVWLE